MPKRKKVKTTLSEEQYRLYWSLKKSTAAVAGYGAGKTESALFRCVDTLREFPHNDLLYVAPTLPLVKDIWYPKIEAHLTNLRESFKIDYQRNIIKVKGRGIIYCRSMANPDRIVGFEALDAFVDELDILPTDKALNVFRKIKGRLRQKPIYTKSTKKFRKRFKLGKKRNQTFLTTTPEGFRATHQLFVKDKLKSSAIVQMSTYSNAHNLPPDYIDELYENYPASLIDAYIYGKFTNLQQGTVYTEFDRDLNHVDIIEQPNEPLFVGMDFNVGKMAATIHVKRSNRPICVGELYKVLDTPAMVEILQAKYPDHPITVYPDATGKNRKSSNASTSDIKIIKNAGFFVRVDYSNPAVKDRINSMNAMLCNAKGVRRYLINTLTCPYYTDCLEQQAYDINGFPDKRNDHDHLPDSGGYFINKDFGIVKPSSSNRKLLM